MFKKILIANRGEIALRIIRTLRAMGIQSVAVYSTIDKNSKFVKEADEAICIGGPKATDSYLNMENIVSAAVLSGSQAIHPGYGFLSENFQFAKLCEECNLKFIGPQPDSIQLMGNKDNARKVMSEYGLEIIPGSETIIERPESALEIAKKIGFPLLIKASSGGGGKGIRKVNSIDELLTSLNNAEKEAEVSFGDRSIYMEKIITNAKHIEIQVLGDKYGNIIGLPERDCSAQHQRQKIIEETPCNLISDKERLHLQLTTVNALKNTGYEGVGTVEFLMDSNHTFYFLEMNTRIQVEHPITEEVTGIDLVKEQIKIASGEKLSINHHDVKLSGYAIEARINAEDPERDFCPQSGIIKHMILPIDSGIRVENGVEEGNKISPFYDSLIMKIIAVASTREEALNKLIIALSKLKIYGLKTNKNFLIKLLKQRCFNNCEYNITYVDEFLKKV